MCHRYGKERDINIAEFVTSLDLSDNQTLFEQNRRMVDYADSLIIFGDKESPERKHLINFATERQLNVHIIQ